MPKKNKSMKKKTAAASPATTVDLSSSTTIASSSSTTIDSSSATTVDLSLSSSTTITSESESYIEMVRYLELDNCQLKQKVQSMEETFTREMSNMEAVYSLVLCNKRKLLDEADMERIELELDIKHLQNDNEDLKSKLEEKEKDLGIAERNVNETRYTDLQLQFDQLLAEKDRDSKKEIDRLKALLDDAQKQKEEKTQMLQELHDQNKVLMHANRDIKLQYKDKIKIMTEQLRKYQDESLKSEKARNIPLKGNKRKRTLLEESEEEREEDSSAFIHITNSNCLFM